MRVLTERLARQQPPLSPQSFQTPYLHPSNQLSSFFPPSPTASTIYTSNAGNTWKTQEIEGNNDKQTQAGSREGLALVMVGAVHGM